MPLKIYKKSRLININFNIIIAGVLATLLVAYPVYLTKMITDSMIEIVLISFFLDAIVDFVIFGALHIFVHKKEFSEFGGKSLVARDISKIQIQRFFLAVIYFIIAVSLHYMLMMSGFTRSLAFVLAYLTALVVSRSVHTIYGLKTGLFEPIFIQYRI